MKEKFGVMGERIKNVLVALTFISSTAIFANFMGGTASTQEANNRQFNPNKKNVNEGADSKQNYKPPIVVEKSSLDTEIDDKVFCKRLIYFAELYLTDIELDEFKSLLDNARAGEDWSIFKYVFSEILTSSFFEDDYKCDLFTYLLDPTGYTGVGKRILDKSKKDKKFEQSCNIFRLTFETKKEFIKYNEDMKKKLMNGKNY